MEQASSLGIEVLEDGGIGRGIRRFCCVIGGICGLHLLVDALQVGLSSIGG